MADIYSSDVFGKRSNQGLGLSRVDTSFAGEFGHEIISQSGLPLAVRDGQPVLPDEAKLARSLVLRRVLIDIPLSAAALLALAPLLAIIAIIIKLTSPGPVLFLQKRTGLGGREFDILKFRSMRTDAGDVTGVKQTTLNDDRVTPVGRFIRATSIDELPQLWNILRGDMSVIGPRPMVPGQLAGGTAYRNAVPYYDFRHLVRPGLSGWAQANGLRGPTTQTESARQRVDHDCAYVQNASVALDVKIILRTIRSEFLTGSGL